MSESLSVAGGVVGVGLSFFLGILGLCAGLLWLVGIGVLHNKLCWKNPNLFPILSLLLFFINPFAIVISIIALSAKSNKMREAAYNNIISDPSDQRVDELIEFLVKFKCLMTLIHGTA